MNRYFAGIGARETPQDILSKMRDIALLLQKKGYGLRSGKAKGADTWFQYGADAYIHVNNSLSFKPTQSQYFTANDATPEAIELASKFHPNWTACKPYVRKLHGRNSMIILGAKLDIPVEFVICWTSDGESSGGTGQALRLSRHYGIPIYNLYSKKRTEQVMELINGKS